MIELKQSISVLSEMTYSWVEKWTIPECPNRDIPGSWDEHVFNMFGPVNVTGGQNSIDSSTIVSPEFFQTNQANLPSLTLGLDTTTNTYKVYYVDATAGSDSNDGLTEATALKGIRKVFQLESNPSYLDIQVKNGDYSNWRYGQADPANGGKSNPAAVTISNANFIKLRAFPGHSPRITFDGSAGIALSSSSNVEITGFEIVGENNVITQTLADQNAAGTINLGNYALGRGIVAWSGDNYYFHNNKIHHCPNVGIRVNNGDYIKIENNQIYSNTWWSKEADSAIVINNATPKDQNADSLKIQIINNQIYDNLHKVALNNQNFLGSGIHLTSNTNYVGAMLIQSNKIYNNGVTGIFAAATDKVEIKDNEIYSNGKVSTAAPFSRASAAGIMLSNAAAAVLQNNYVITDAATDVAYDLQNTVSFNTNNTFDNFACLGSINSGYGNYANMQYYPGCQDRHNTFTTYYVSGDGKDSNDGLTEATAVRNIRNIFNNKITGDPSFVKVLVKNGDYKNWRYGQGHPDSGGKSNPAVVTVTNGYYVKIQNYPGHSPKIMFDGSGGILMTGCNFTEISGFEVVGPNQAITQAQAEANRLLQDTYFSGRGIVAWSGHNYYIHNNKVHDCPNSGIRTNKGDYNRIENNQVYRNTWWSSNAESGIVFADSRNLDTYTGIKMTIKNNIVYENINKISYYNSHYDDPQYLIDNQMSVARENYGSSLQDFIIDGSGVYITRNAEHYTHGRFELSNNVCYLNGINGVVVHKTNRAWVHHNEIYNNGQVSKDPPASRQGFAGLVINTGTDVTLHDNTVTTQRSDDYAYVLTGTSSFNEAESHSNWACVGLIDSDYGTRVSMLAAGCEAKYA